MSTLLVVLTASMAAGDGGPRMGAALTPVVVTLNRSWRGTWERTRFGDTFRADLSKGFLEIRPLRGGAPVQRIIFHVVGDDKGFALVRWGGRPNHLDVHRACYQLKNEKIILRIAEKPDFPPPTGSNGDHAYVFILKRVE